MRECVRKRKDLNEMNQEGVLGLENHMGESHGWFRGRNLPINCIYPKFQTADR